MPSNQQIVLDNRPQGEAVASNFKLVATDTPALKEGEVLVRHHFLSLDPYMRGRMNESKSYAASQGLGEVMIGGTVGEVLESKHPKYMPWATRWWAWVAGRNTAWSMAMLWARCARWTPRMCRCRTTWAPWVCPA